MFIVPLIALMLVAVDSPRLLAQQRSNDDSERGARGRAGQRRDDDDRGRNWRARFRRSRGDIRGDDRDDRRRGRRGFNVEEWISRLDRDESGTLEGDELNDRSRRFLQRLQLDVSSSVKVSQLVERVQEMRAEREEERRERQIDSMRLVPGFGVQVERERVPDFSLTADENSENSDGKQRVPTFELPDELLAEALVSIDEQFDGRVSRRVESVFQRYDENRNLILDQNEITGIRWGDPPWREFDSNNDGKMSKLELAKRYQAEQEREEERRRRRRDGDNERRRRWEERRRQVREQREEADNNSERRSSSTSTSSSNTSQRSRSVKYANSVFERKDKDKNGRIEGDEMESIGILKKADANSDGAITRRELLAHLNSDQNGGGRESNSGASSRRASRAGRTSGDAGIPRISRDGGRTTTVRLPNVNDNLIRTQKESPYRHEGSSSFRRRDANEDGQIQLSEFADKIDKQSVEEFQSIDANQDGVITAAEWADR